MLNQFLIGLSVIVVTGFIHASVLSFALDRHQSLTAWARTHSAYWQRSIALGISIVWVMFAHLIEVFVWSFVYLVLGVFDAMEPAVYFVLVAYTTLGFGDIIISESWRLLAGLTAANGFLAFGWSAAFQVEYFSRLSKRGADGNL